MVGVVPEAEHEQLHATIEDLEARLAKAESFRADIEKAWRWAIETSRPNATYIIGNKLRRGIREALERHRDIEGPR